MGFQDAEFSWSMLTDGLSASKFYPIVIVSMTLIALGIIIGVVMLVRGRRTIAATLNVSASGSVGRAFLSPGTLLYCKICVAAICLIFFC